MTASARTAIDSKRAELLTAAESTIIARGRIGSVSSAPDRSTGIDWRIQRRILVHPHDNEQPFRRSQSGIKIPEGITVVLVQAGCTRHDFEGKTVLVDLAKREGPDYKVQR